MPVDILFFELIRVRLTALILILMSCVTGPAQVEARRNTHYDHVNGAMAGYFYGRHLIKVKLIQSPEEQYRARVAKQENVDTLEKSLQQYGTVNEHVELVLFVAASKQLSGEGWVCSPGKCGGAG